MERSRKDKDFWRTVCQQQNLGQQLRNISELKDGVFFYLPDFGGTRITVTRGSALGDNYMSDVYRCLAKTEDGTEYRSFIKILPGNPLFRDAAIAGRVYHREIGMFTTILPKLNQLRQELGLEEDQVPLKVPEVLYFHMEELVKGEKDGSGTIIVLEDLKCKGFRNAEFRKAGCGVDHAEMALRSLANYHALSIAFVRKFKNADGCYDFPPELQFIITKTMMDEQPEEMFRGYLTTYYTFLRNKGELEAAIWLEKLEGRLSDILKYKTLEDCGPLACILHGDFWNNNMMFSYVSEDDNKPMDIRMIDWQISRPGHPTSDILYFLNSTTTVDTRKQHLNFLIDSYFNTLNTSLKHLGIDLESENYNKESFLKEYHEKLYWGLYMGFMLLPNILDNKMATEAKLYEEECKNNEKSSDEEKEEEIGALGMRLETEEKFKEMASRDFLSHNDLLSQRVIELVKETKEMITKPPTFLTE